MLVVDTSVLVAAANRREPHHEACAELLRAEIRPFVPAPVVTETCIMLNRRLGPEYEARFLEMLHRGAFEIEHLDMTGYRRAAELVATYVDRRPASSRTDASGAAGMMKSSSSPPCSRAQRISRGERDSIAASFPIRPTSRYSALMGPP